MTSQAHARRTDPRTSLEAADSVKRIRKSQKVILDLLKKYAGLTDEDIFEYVAPMYAISPSGCRSRRAELVTSGLVRDTGRRGVTKSGRKTIIWEAVPMTVQLALI